MVSGTISSVTISSHTISSVHHFLPDTISSLEYRKLQNIGGKKPAFRSAVEVGVKTHDS
jgi:hypothetical protein